VLAFALSFAGGAVLASLADTRMPEAFEHGRPPQRGSRPPSASCSRSSCPTCNRPLEITPKINQQAAAWDVLGLPGSRSPADTSVSEGGRPSGCSDELFGHTRGLWSR
jgi:hypothetical protein